MATNISYKKLDQVCDQIDARLKSLKAANGRLDDATCALYEVLQHKPSLSMYSKFASHIDRNYFWAKKFASLNRDVEALRRFK